ncbi:hypothetical protein Nepgr_012560 [Nepenthes gracilis]|uniref:Uncharacterized protein n=1 Tax=Nepenthes gracilis TaxID=150966 RepID=A0AAD3SHF7_NEPGR|nr:hypothetical protein Nepgr_012560 [Nepenthes gracilis]
MSGVLLPPLRPLDWSYPGLLKAPTLLLYLTAKDVKACEAEIVELRVLPKLTKEEFAATLRKHVEGLTEVDITWLQLPLLLPKMNQRPTLRPFLRRNVKLPALKRPQSGKEPRQL